jgi:type II secretory pathway pseudopilin PulG
VVSPRTPRRAFALVDVVVATVLLGVSLASILGLTSRAIDAQVRGERLRTAAMLLDEQLNLVLARGPDSYAKEFPTEGRCDPPFEDYRFELDFDSQGSGDPYVVVATITWTSLGRERSESVTTLMAPRLGEDPDPIRAPARVVERDY